MAVNSIDFLVGDTTRNPSRSIWGNCPWDAILEGSIGGYYFWDDFMSAQPTVATTEANWAAGNGYAQYSDTGGTITNDTTELGGAVAIGAPADNAGCSFRTLITPFKLAQASKRFWFEARILSSTITDAKHNIFIGLMENTSLTATVPITATGTLADKNLVGFQRPETARTVAGTGGGIMNTVYKASGVTAVTVQADAVTLTAGAYVKLGMYYEPSGDRQGSYALKFYANGVQLATSKLLPSAVGTDFPNGISLGPVFAVLNATGSTPGTSSIDWWRAASLV
jgi:hypothetical protein